MILSLETNMKLSMNLIVTEVFQKCPELAQGEHRWVTQDTIITRSGWVTEDF